MAAINSPPNEPIQNFNNNDDVGLNSLIETETEHTNSTQDQNQQISPKQSPSYQEEKSGERSKVANDNCESLEEDSSADYNPLNEHDYCNSDSKSSSYQQNNNKKSNSKRVIKFDKETESNDRSRKEHSENAMQQNNTSDNFSDSSSLHSNKDLVIAQDLKFETSDKISSSNAKKKPCKSFSGDTNKSSGQKISKQTIMAETKTRTQRARRSVSVTDKSEWIMGEEQLDSVLSEHLDELSSKRRRVDDGSSDYTGSEDSGEESEDENDPNKLWCVCRKPHGNQFMIECDICKDWFHGHCVGVTELMGDKFRKQRKEWFCSECHEKLSSGLPRGAISTKKEKKQTKKKQYHAASGRKRPGRPKKSESMTGSRISARVARKSSSSLDPRTGVDNGRLKKNLSRVDSQPHGKFEEDRRIKELIRERKKDFFFKRKLAEQQNLARRNELGLGKPSLTANLSGGLDSLASSTSSPNLPEIAVPKSEAKHESKSHKSKPIVLQISTKKDGSSEDTSNRIVAKIVRSSEKHKKRKRDSFDATDSADPIQKKTKLITDDLNDSIDTSTRKRSDSTSFPSKSSTKKSQQKDASPNSERAAESKHIIMKIKESLELRSKNIKDLDVSSEKIEELSQEIEGQLKENFKEGTTKYKAKFRSLVFNLKDVKNEGLVKKVLTGEIPPNKLVKMSPDEMASHELAKWRERENKHSIELIKRDAEMTAQQVIVKKTHKGEEVIAGLIPDDMQDKPADDKNVSTPSEVNGVVSDSLKVVPVTPSNGASVSKISECKQEVSEASHNDSSYFPDILSHLKDQRLTIDANTKNEVETKDANNATLSESQHIKLEHQINEPKRIRVNIETKLDPTKLSQLRVPLIKPEPQEELGSPMDVEENDSKSPTDVDENEESEDNGEEDDAYDPELPVTQVIGKVVKPHDNYCWSGSITMPDVAKFNAYAKPVNGALDALKKEASESLTVCGRIAPDQVQEYIRKLKSTSKNEILLAQIFPATSSDESNFTTFFEYLYSRNRYGVIQVSPQILKDFYILPVHERGSIPEIFRPSNSQDIDRANPNSLLALIVRSKRNQANNASYKPSKQPS